MSNWYTFFKNAFRNKYDIASQNLASIIFKKFKENEMDDYVFGFSKDISDELAIEHVEVVSNKNKKMPDPFIVSGTFYYERVETDKYSKEFINKKNKKQPATIRIIITINTEIFDETHYNDLYLEILGAVRHEIEHAVSRKYRDYFDDGPKISREENVSAYFKKVFDYLNNDNEIESLVRQYFLIAKKKGKGKNNYVDPAFLIRKRALRYLGIAEWSEEHQGYALDSVYIKDENGEEKTAREKLQELEDKYKEIIEEIKKGGRTW